MEGYDHLTVRFALFVTATVLNTMYSWRSLHNSRVHGFYRFFVFEGIIFLLVINGLMGATLSPRWLKNFSQFLNALAVLSVVAGYYQLRRSGSHAERIGFSENRHFENTARLIASGIYRYVRHPMYGSLLLYAWGIYLGYPTVAGTPVVILATLAVYVAAKVEEQENIAYFGNEYQEYMKTTKMFIPYIL